MELLSQLLDLFLQMGSSSGEKTRVGQVRESELTNKSRKDQRIVFLSLWPNICLSTKHREVRTPTPI